MEAVAEYFIDQVETLRDRDLADEEKEELTERFQQMYETRDCYILYSRFLEQEGYKALPRLPLEKRNIRYEDVLSDTLSEIFSVQMQGTSRNQACGSG